MEYVVIYFSENKQVNQIVKSLDELKQLGKDLQKARIDYRVLSNRKLR